MKKTLLLASLVSFFIGCAHPGAWWKSRVVSVGGVAVVVTDDGHAVDIVNRSGADLSNVSLRVLVSNGFVWFSFPRFRAELLRDGEKIEVPTRFNLPVDAVEVRGYSAQGAIEMDWTRDISPR